MSRDERDCALDLAVGAAQGDLDARRFREPRALYLLGTGGGLLPLRLKSEARASLAEIAGVPEAWRGGTLRAGEIDKLSCWILEDAPGPSDRGALPAEDEPGWVRGFPCWLAAAAGAAVLVHTSAGASLGEEIEPGSIVLVSDHINLSGRTPLHGLAGSGLGPLYPDPKRLHHAGLRKRALAICKAIGLPAREAVAACTATPALETPAELRFYASTGAQVAVQGLEGPLLAAAHAGLSSLAIVGVTDRGEGKADIAGIVAAAERIAPGLDELLARLASAIARAADDLEVEA